MTEYNKIWIMVIMCVLIAIVIFGLSFVLKLRNYKKEIYFLLIFFIVLSICNSYNVGLYYCDNIYYNIENDFFLRYQFKNISTIKDYINLIQFYENNNFLTKKELLLLYDMKKFMDQEGFFWTIQDWINIVFCYKDIKNIYSFKSIIEIYEIKLIFPKITVSEINFLYKMQQNYTEYTLVDLKHAYNIFVNYGELKINIKSILEIIEIKKIFSYWKIDQLLDLYFNLNGKLGKETLNYKSIETTISNLSDNKKVSDFLKSLEKKKNFKLDIVALVKMYEYYYYNWTISDYIIILKYQLNYPNSLAQFRAIKNTDNMLNIEEIIRIYEDWLKYKKKGYNLTLKQVVEIYKEINKKNWNNEEELLKNLLEVKFKNKDEWIDNFSAYGKYSTFIRSNSIK